MSTSRAMEPLSVVLNQIMKRGYEDELKIGQDGAWFKEGGRKYLAAELLIEKVYRFEGESDPADMSVLYIISAKGGGEAGYLLNAYGAYSAQDNPFYDQFIINIPVSEKRKDTHDQTHHESWGKMAGALSIIARVQGIYYLLFGLWPMVHMGSFEQATGFKIDKFMVYTISGLLIAVGLFLLRFSRMRQI